MGWSSTKKGKIIIKDLEPGGGSGYDFEALRKRVARWSREEIAFFELVVRK